MLKCPAIAQVERDTIGQRDSRFIRVARSLGLEVCGCTTFGKFFNRMYFAWQEQVPNRVETTPR